MKDVSQLVRYEIDLAKTELRGDLKRVGLAGALGGVAAFTGCLVLVLLCIAFAYGLTALGIWTWAAFLIVAGVCVVLAGAAVGIAFLKIRRLSGMKKTRESVTEGLGMLRHDGKDHDGKQDAKSIASTDGQGPRPVGVPSGSGAEQRPAGEIGPGETSAGQAGTGQAGTGQTSDGKGQGADGASAEPSDGTPRRGRRSAAERRARRSLTQR